MARIVPAKPRTEIELALEAIVALERNIDDRSIVFQSLDDENSILVGGEGSPWVVVTVVENVSSYDKDGEEFVLAKGSLDPFSTNKAARKFLAQRGVDEFQHVFLLGAESSTSLPEVIGSFKCVPTVEALVELIRGVNGDTSAEQVNQVLQALSEGSSEYVPGKITGAQARWRSQEHGEADEDGFVAEVVTEEVAITRPKRIRTADERIVLNKSSAQRVRYVEDLVRSCVANIQGDKPIFSCGVEIDPDFVAGADALLPVVMIAAADKWGTVVSKAKGVGGFDIRLAKDPEALVGMRVIDVLASSPFLLFMPLAHVFKKTSKGAEFNQDELIGLFSRWVEKHGIDDTSIEEIDINIALKAIEGE